MSRPKYLIQDYYIDLLSQRSPEQSSLPDTMSTAIDGNPFEVPESTNFYHWKGKHDFLTVRDAEISRHLDDPSGRASQYFVFLGVSLTIFHQYFADSDDRQFDADSYYVKEEAIVVKIRSAASETAHKTFLMILTTKLYDMNMDKKLVAIGSSTVKTNKRYKEPDESYRPVSLPKGRSRQWPSLVVEVGVSESMTKLAHDARWWLTESIGEVRNVITILVQKSTGKITIEKWDQGPEPTFPRVSYRTVLSREIISDNVNMSKDTPMTIPFESLFLRPAEGLIERDVEFDRDDMMRIADRVWDEL